MSDILATRKSAHFLNPNTRANNQVALADEEEPIEARNPWVEGIVSMSLREKRHNMLLNLLCNFHS